MEWIISALSALIIIAVYVIYNLLKKYEKLEGYVIKQDTFISKLSETIHESSIRLNEIDQKGAFQADDEVGWFFDELKKINVMLNNFIIDKYEKT